MKLLSALVILSLLPILSAADCSGILEVYNIHDRNAGETVDATIHTTSSTTINSSTYGPWILLNVTRNVDVYLIDDKGNQLSVIRSRFRTDQTDTTLATFLQTNNNFLNSSYRIKADMQVFDSNNMSTMLCAQMAYSDWFWIRTNRSYNGGSAMYFDLSTYFPYYDFFTTQRKCAESEGRCIELNVSGQLPANFTLLPVLNWNPPNVTETRNLSVSLTEKYDGAFLMALSNNITSCTSALSNASQQLINDTISYQLLYASKQELQANLNALNADKSAKVDECATYKLEHPYKTFDAFGAGCIAGAVALIFLMYFYNKRETTESIHENL